MELLLHSIDWSKNYTDITQEVLDIILACKKSVLINNDTTWVKTGNDNFDVTMGSFDSVQITGLVGIYILYTLGRITNSNNISIYRVHGLISIPNINGPLISKIQKKVIRAFKYMGLKIEIRSNLNNSQFFRHHFQFEWRFL